MKRATYIVLILSALLFAAFCSVCAAADDDFDPQAAAEKAKKRLSDGDYLKAAESYKQLWDNGSKSADVAYNAGTAYARAGRLGMGVLFLERAKILAPNDSDVKANLATASKQAKKIGSAASSTQDEKAAKASKVSSDDESGLTLQSILDVLSSDAWAALFIACMWGASLMAVMLLFARTARNKKRASAGLVAAAVLTVVFGSLFYLKAKDDVLTDWGVVVAQTCEVKEGPHENFPTSFKAYEGTKAALSEEMEGWRKISSPNGLTGYVKASDVEKIAAF